MSATEPLVPCAPGTAGLKGQADLGTRMPLGYIIMQISQVFFCRGGGRAKNSNDAASGKHGSSKF